MTLTDVIDREVAGPDGPLRIAAMYASLPPGIRQGDTGQRGRIYAEVEDRHGRRWQGRATRGDDPERREIHGVDQR